MRWIIGALFVAAFASLGGASHAVTPGAMTATVESAREATTSVTEVATRRRPATHRRITRHRRPAVTR
jgi:hypothetical protein